MAADDASGCASLNARTAGSNGCSPTRNSRSTRCARWPGETGEPVATAPGGTHDAGPPRALGTTGVPHGRPAPLNAAPRASSRPQRRGAARASVSSSHASTSSRTRSAARGAEKVRSGRFGLILRHSRSRKSPVFLGFTRECRMVSQGLRPTIMHLSAPCERLTEQSLRTGTGVGEGSGSRFRLPLPPYAVAPRSATRFDPYRRTQVLSSAPGQRREAPGSTYSTPERPRPGQSVPGECATRVRREVNDCCVLPGELTRPHTFSSQC